MEQRNTNYIQVKESNEKQIAYQPFPLLVSLRPLLVVDGSRLGVLQIAQRCTMHISNRQN